MKLSRKADYALRALLHLCGRPRTAVPVRELADANGIPRKFLENIMRDLREMELVESVAGKNGGYVLVRRPDGLSIGEVLRHFDGRLEEAEQDDVLGEPDSESVPTARVRRTLREIGGAVDRLMDSTTLEDVLKDRPIRYRISNDGNFTHGGGI